MDAIDTSNPLKPSIVKDPNARLDYAWDWTDWLEEGDSISEAVVLTSGTLAADPPLLEAARVTVFLSGGKVGVTETATCRVTTAAGRIDDRTLYLRIKPR